WSRHWIFGVKLDAESDIDSMEEFMPDYGFVRPIDMDFGPEGSLYLIEYGETWGENADCKLVRIDYIRGNRPPRIKLTAAGTAGRPPLKVAFSSEGTVDPDGDALTYEWKIVPGTDELKDTSANPTLAFETMGSYQAVLTVTDEHGAAATASTPVLVGNEPPLVEFTSPQDGDFYDFDSPISWDIAVVDPEDGNPVPERVKIFHQLVPGNFKDTEASLTGAETLHPGLELMKKSDCFNCHVVDRKLVGPSYLEVAAKYKDQKHALDEVAKRIVTGSSGIWGEIPMIPHPQHGIEQSRQMAEWIFSLGEADSSSVLSGLTGEFKIGKPKKQDKKKGPGVLVVEATYLDGGAPPIAPLSGTKSIRLRNSTLLPGQADDYDGLTLSGTKAGSIMDKGWLKFSQVNLSDRTKASVTYASASHGGTIEIRHAAADGELLGSVKAEPTGDWNKRKTLNFAIKPAPARGDLYICFSNPGKAHLMNLESITFTK
ncbi:MAG: carbohydrate-binding protein, partial [Verrucomicrobiales bacterium]|nr:carbohydrate-binding protein [Verrucomicrobiales bacterium]